ncbi:TPR repeat-containing protein [Cryptosporidium muris RN66]|uniref:TPR repeat-containing protein n=1 Tax=Cryptosporidium muris (strain RN66) TaxID=441375 RepID=B6AFG7_CRYMR|nr:TPR repeat-containing protein [Cryptosporidium muris RN66]EEA06958.1 TPR repeat-containing protein [Cryptosporidium muris RN66]|eukprot:XP_002141307.1 TPR repeat-containing protein [Cryptosporidium muris RN66]
MDLIKKCHYFKFFGITYTSEWLCELWDSCSVTENFAEVGGLDACCICGTLNSDNIKLNMKLMNAKIYFDSREYRRVIAVLSNFKDTDDCAETIFFRSYAALLSLEKPLLNISNLEQWTVTQPESQIMETRISEIEASISNYLAKQDKMFKKTKCNSMHGLLQWLLSIAVYRQNRYTDAYYTQIASLWNEPLNWSCWVDLINNLVSHGNSKIKTPINDSENSSNYNISFDYLKWYNTDNYSMQFADAHKQIYTHKQFNDQSYSDFSESLGIPSHWCGRFAFALYLSLVGRWKDSLEEYTLLLQIFPNSAYILSQLAKCHYELGKIDQAISLFNKISNMHPYYLRSVVEMATILAQRNDIDELSILARKCSNLAKYSPETSIVMGIYHWSTNDRHKALKFYKRALVLNSQSSSAWILCGYALHELNNIRGSLYAYKTAIALSPTNTTALYGIAEIYSKLNMPMHAIRFYEKSIAQSPEDSHLWSQLGQIFEKINRIEDATRCVYKAFICEIAKDPKSESTIRYMGKLLKLEAEQWHNEEASAWANKIIQTAIEHGYIENICNTELSKISKDVNSPETEDQDEKPCLRSDCNLESSLDWENLRWSVHIIPQKLPTDIIAALEWLVQLYSDSNQTKDCTTIINLLTQIKESLKKSLPLNVDKDVSVKIRQ